MKTGVEIIAEEERQYAEHEVVTFEDPVYGICNGIVSHIRKYKGRIIIHINQSNGDSYQFYKEDLDLWN